MWVGDVQASLQSVVAPGAIEPLENTDGEERAERETAREEKRGRKEEEG